MNQNYTMQAGATVLSNGLDGYCSEAPEDNLKLFLLHFLCRWVVLMPKLKTMKDGTTHRPSAVHSLPISAHYDASP